MTYQETKDYITKNGITLFTVHSGSDKIKCLPDGTKLYLGIGADGCVSSYGKNTEYRNNKFNYQFYYRWSKYLERGEYTFQLVEEKTLETLEVGDLVVKNDLFGKVMAVIIRNGEETIYVMSYPSNDKTSDDFKKPKGLYSVMTLKKNNYQFYKEEPAAPIEVTIDEIAEWKNINPKLIKIKK